MSWVKWHVRGARANAWCLLILVHVEASLSFSIWVTWGALCMTKCLKLQIFGPLLKKFNSKVLSQKTPSRNVELNFLSMGPKFNSFRHFVISHPANLTVHVVAVGAVRGQVAGSLRTSTRTDIETRLTCRVDASADARARFVH